MRGQPCGQRLSRMSNSDGLDRMTLSMALSTSSWNDARSYGQLAPLPLPGGSRHDCAPGGVVGAGVGVPGAGAGVGVAGAGVCDGRGTGTMMTGICVGPVGLPVLVGSSSRIVWQESATAAARAAVRVFRVVIL